MFKRLFSTYLILASGLIYTGFARFAVTPAEAAPKYKGEVSISHKIEHKKTKYKPVLIQDKLAEELKTQKLSKKRFEQQIIEDETAKSVQANKISKKKYKKEMLNDTPVLLTEENKKFKTPVYSGVVKADKGEAVILKPLHKISTRTMRVKFQHNKKYEKYRIALPEAGEKIAFKVVKDVYKNSRIIIPKNTIVYAQIGEVSPRAMGGAPAELTLEKFEMKDKNGNTIPLAGKISSSGYSLSVWIGIAELATTPFLIGLAVPVLRILPGGQAVISPKKEYVVYY